jgi:hypothetical protein
MSTAPAEQRNAYKGGSPRAWLRLRLVGKNAVEERDFLVDSGSPFDLIVDVNTMLQFGVTTGQTSSTNFGVLVGGWLQLQIPDVGFDQPVEVFASNAAVNQAKRSCPDFEGLVGLPLLRQFVYGGDADFFWIRPQGATP